MNRVTDYKKQKSKATRGIVASAAILVLALSIGLAGLFFFLDAWAQAKACQQRQEQFNPWADSKGVSQDCYKAEEIIGLTEEFASDFKETYHYYFAFDKDWYPFIVKMKGRLGDEFQPLMDHVYTDGSEEPEPVLVRGVAIPIEDDIREFAIECMNILYDEEFMTDENFEDYLGISVLDMTQKPVGRADFSVGGIMGALGAMIGFVGIIGLWSNIQNRKKAVQEEQRRAENMRQAGMWQNSEDGGPGYGFWNPSQGQGGWQSAGSGTGTGGPGEAGQGPETAWYGSSYSDGMGQNQYGYAGPDGTAQSQYGYAGPAGAGQNEYGYTGSDATGYTNGSGVRLVPVKKSNVFLGILGALGGSLVGVALWLLISAVGFIAGFAGFVMLKLALKGYEKLSGRLDKKGAVISLIIAMFMVLFANVLDYVVGMCQAFFQWDASLDTVWYVITNFGSLMTEADTWGGFYLNLVLGYALSIWSSYPLIGRIISYKER